MFLVLALLAMTAGSAFAQETTPITGTIQSVVIETDAATGETVVAVTLLDETAGTTQTVNISLETAESLGLVVTDPNTGESTVAEAAVGTTVEIDPTTVIPEETTEEDQQHPVGSALADFFSDLLGVDYETIMDYHDQGVGFGVIAQALWLSNSLDGGSATFEALLDAKQSGDYSAITLADGSTPDNWGAVVTSLKKGDNLGSVMSGEDKSNENSNDKSNEKSSQNSTKDSTKATIDKASGNKNKNNNSGNGGGNSNKDNKGNGGNNGNGNGGGGGGNGH